MNNQDKYYNNKQRQKSSEIALAVGLIGGIITILALITINIINQLFLNIIKQRLEL